MFPLSGPNMVNKQKTVLLMMIYPQAAMHGTMRRPSKGRHAHSTQAGGSQQEYCCPGRWGLSKYFFLALPLSFILSRSFLSLSFSLFLFLSWQAVQDIPILLFVTKKPLLGDYQREDDWIKNRFSFDQSDLFVRWSTFDASFEYF